MVKKRSNLFILICLGTLWSTFAIFTKIPAEVLSPYFVAFSRLAIGGVLIYVFTLFRGKKVFIKENFRNYAITGFFNSALPFTLFAIAAKPLDSGIVAILDGAVPMFEVLLSIFILRNHVDKNAIIGVIFGIVGVTITSMGNGLDFANLWKNIFFIIAILIACASYAGASLYINAKCKHIEPIVLACGSVIFAALFLSPSLFLADFSVINFKVGSSLLALGIFCTGIAYIFYFKLTVEEGSRFALSVVLLIPVFGAIFGTIFMNEVMSINKIIGCLTILISMKFILNLSHKNFFKTDTAPII
jgi:drug/metabolite transporter (DMT)-like permease